MRYVITIISLLFLYAGCQKEKRAYNVLGKYDCQVTSSWVQNLPTYTSGSSTSQEKIEIQKKGYKKGQIEVLGDIVTIDKTKHYRGKHKLDSYDDFDISFINDSVFIQYSSGGMAGGTVTCYKGKKI